MKSYSGKSTVAQIKERFDHEVERFANLETGQVATIDARVSLELITEAAARWVPGATHLLDMGCGAGNYTLMMLSKMPDLHCTMVDLSEPMLLRARERVEALTKRVEIRQGDIREVDLPAGQFDIVLAGAVLHHLRDDADWEQTFEKVGRILRPGGCLMISDLVTQDIEILSAFIWEKYGDYLEGIGGPEYREKVLAYIDLEDSPRSVNYQLDLMKKSGFTQVEILHKNLCFAAFGGRK